MPSTVNLKWFVNTEWALNFDYQHVESEVEVLSNTIWTSTFQNALMDLNGSKLPSIVFTPPITGGAPGRTAIRPKA